MLISSFKNIFSYISSSLIILLILKYKNNQNNQKLFKKDKEIMKIEQENKENKENKEDYSGYESLIGNTPLLKLNKLSKIIKNDIYVKMENLNPGGTGKDRAAQRMIQCAEREGLLKPGGDVVEGTSGSTGIALASICLARGYQLHIVMPDDQAEEKRIILEKLGAKVVVVPCCAISNEGHYVRVAAKLAKTLNGFYVNQFENIHNSEVHFEITGPELYQQCNKQIDAFIMSSGTGGTIAGISRYLKQEHISPQTKIILADPNGSSLANHVKYGICYTVQQSERQLKRNRYDSIVEGVGIDRLTANYITANIDDSITVSDQDLLEMAHWILENEGIMLGSSSALNITATCIYALQLQQELKLNQNNNLNNHKRKKLVTIICDSGTRHLSRFWNPNYITKYNLTWPQKGVIPNCLKEFLNSDTLS